MIYIYNAQGKKRRRGEEERELCALLEELDERAEKRFEEREERMRKFEMEMEEKRADREEKMEESTMRMLAGLFQAYTPHGYSQDHFTPFPYPLSSTPFTPSHIEHED